MPISEIHEMTFTTVFWLREKRYLRASNADNRKCLMLFFDLMAQKGLRIQTPFTNLLLEQTVYVFNIVKRIVKKEVQIWYDAKLLSSDKGKPTTDVDSMC